MKFHVNQKHSLSLKYFIGILICLVASQCLRAGPVDSLLQVLQVVDNDSQRMATHTELGFAFWDRQELETSRQHFQQAIQLADEREVPLAQAQNRRFLGMLWAAQAHHDSALRNYEAADHYFSLADDDQEWMKLKVDLGNAHYFLAAYQSAVRSYQQADSLAELVGGLSRERGIILGNLGTLLMEMDLPTQALKYNQQAIALARKDGDMSRLGISLHNLGGIYEVLDSLEKGRQYYEQALAIADSLPDARLQGYCHHSLASVSSKTGQLPQAITHARMALDFATNQEEDILYRSRLGLFLSQQGRYIQAEELLLDALARSEELNLPGYTLEIVGFLEEHFARKGDVEKAYKWSTRHRIMQDSIQSHEVEKQVRALEKKYQTEQTEKENLQLKAENQAQAARLNLQRLALVFALGLIVLGIVAFYFYRKNLEGKRKLARQAADLQAQRIQQMEKEHQLIAMQAMVDGQESERSRLAKDLHDGLGGLLSTIRLQLDQLKENDAAVEANGLHHAQELLDKASTELRRIAHNLMPQALVKFGLRSALEDFVGDINQSKVLQIDLQLYGLQERFAQVLELTLYRIIQELVHNILKHAQATEALVQVLRREGRIYLTVEDNGKGIAASSMTTKGQGLANLRSRVEYLQGKLEIDSQPGEGTTVYIEFDIKPAPHDPTHHR